MSDDEFDIKPGRVQDRGGRSAKAKSLVAQVLALSNKAGRVGISRSSGRGTGRLARGRSAALGTRSYRGQRRVLVKARVVRHSGSRYSATPLLRHMTYLKREGVSRDGENGELFGPDKELEVDNGFADRTAGDRHHFRFIVSPEDAGELADVRAFTRELMTDIQADLGTRLGWVAVDHWNTDNPHIHILVRGRTDNGQDLVIDKDYIKEGMRGRAEARVTAELGLRSELEIDKALAREVGADRLTSLDRRLQRIADHSCGVIDLRPSWPRSQSPVDRHLIGRAAKLERLGLARKIAPACWRLERDAQRTLRELGLRGDIIKTMHQAMSRIGADTDTGRFALHQSTTIDAISGRLIERGLQDELTGEAYAVIDGVDGRVHHLRFRDLEATSDAASGAIVEVRSWNDRRGRPGQSLSVRSDLQLAEQITASGSTWLDGQLISSELPNAHVGFGAELEMAKSDRTEFLISQGLATRTNGQTIFARDLLTTLRSRELNEAAGVIAARTGLSHIASINEGRVSGIYRERIHLASGRFAMIENGPSFQLIPWRPQLERQLGQYVTGTLKNNGGMDWMLGRSKGVSI